MQLLDKCSLAAARRHVTLSTVMVLTKRNFVSEVLQSSTPVLVYFWAGWCGRCKTITLILDELADEYENRVKIGSVNIDEQPLLAAKYDVRAIPTMLLLREGRVAEQIVGLRSKYELEDSLRQALA